GSVTLHCLLLCSHSCHLFYPPPTAEFYTLSLHDALPISEFGMLNSHSFLEVMGIGRFKIRAGDMEFCGCAASDNWFPDPDKPVLDRKSTRLNSSHVKISYAVFCLKKKKKEHDRNEC